MQHHSHHATCDLCRCEAFVAPVSQSAVSRSVVSSSVSPMMFGAKPKAAPKKAAKKLAKKVAKKAPKKVAKKVVKKAAKKGAPVGCSLRVAHTCSVNAATRPVAAMLGQNASPLYHGPHLFATVAGGEQEQHPADDREVLLECAAHTQSSNTARTERLRPVSV